MRAFVLLWFSSCVLSSFTTPQIFAQAVVEAKKEFVVDQKFLLVPIKNDAPQHRVTFSIDGKEVYSSTIPLASDNPDWHAMIDLETLQGATLSLATDKPELLNGVVLANEIPVKTPLYEEARRPQLSFSARRGWLNDPNGLAYFNGEYHLFFQHNPFGWQWGNMHWGHATSPDLIHWTEKPIALAPDQFGAMFSGSGVVDTKNTSGLGKDGKLPLVLLYTAFKEPATQCLAYTLDGIRVTKFEGNPVLPQITPGNRDPKVFWHEPTERWVMVLYVGVPQQQPDGKSRVLHTVQFFTSPNLKDWTFGSQVDGGLEGDPYLYECPDLFPLQIAGSDDSFWVLTAADSQYALGKFDGVTFTPIHSRLPGVRGRGFYAAQTFSDLPDGRRVQIGWMRSETPGMPFNHCMTIPLALGLTSTENGPRLTMNPIKELESLRSSTTSMKQLTLSESAPDPLSKLTADVVEINAEIVPSDFTPENELILNVRGAEIRVDCQRHELSVQGAKAPLQMQKGPLHMTVFLDRTTLYVFCDNGLTFLTVPFQPSPENHSLSLKASKGAFQIPTLEVHDLKSAWKK